MNREWTLVYGFLAGLALFVVVWFVFVVVTPVAAEIEVVQNKDVEDSTWAC